ncbi:class II aldolase/adducin family protein [Nonomuraea sp. NN258]|uniref:class II aldolase/adducin family protein n=1 Tax=Nonomuraea antri TaxID=2730852 RepID=UPI00156981D6|nr:class II aldolase/adducin family protein [Nonomuraea antri]NRQ31801.1 class II aldolase/adducin family protein [Nonomuraea antri]
MAGELDELRRTVALGCRIVAAAGLTTPLLGHISLRVGRDRVLVRCRGPRERGLLFTTVADVRLVSLDDEGDVGDGYRLPHEYPIHAEILRARPDLVSVLHAHPRSALLGGLARVPLRPVFGAYDIPAFLLADGGVPVYPHAGLVRTAAAGARLARVLGGSAVVLLRGHGVVTAGQDVPQALSRLLALDELLRISVELARLGAAPAEVSEQDRAHLPDLGAAFNEQALWRHHVALLELRGLADAG